MKATLPVSDSGALSQKSRVNHTLSANDHILIISWSFESSQWHRLGKESAREQLAYSQFWMHTTTSGAVNSRIGWDSPWQENGQDLPSF